MIIPINGLVKAFKRVEGFGEVNWGKLQKFYENDENKLVTKINGFSVGETEECAKTLNLEFIRYRNMGHMFHVDSADKRFSMLMTQMGIEDFPFSLNDDQPEDWDQYLEEVNYNVSVISSDLKDIIKLKSFNIDYSGIITGEGEDENGLFYIKGEKITTDG